MINNKVKIKTTNLNVYYGDKQALNDVNLEIHSKEVTALIGPSGWENLHI
jgi:ABC-type phosphate transport system, ATPase component